LRLRDAVLDALDELAEREGVSRSLLIKQAISLLFKERGVEVYVKEPPPRKEPKALVKTVRGGGVLILAPKGSG